MATREKGPVFRATGLPASRPDHELDSAIQGVIHNNLTEDERSKLTGSTAIVPSCYDNKEKAALVEFHGGVPVFLSKLTDDPRDDWQSEMCETDISFDWHFLGFTQLYTLRGDLSVTAEWVASFPASDLHWLSLTNRVASSPSPASTDTHMTRGGERGILGACGFATSSLETCHTAAL